MKNKASALVFGILPYIVGCIAVPVFFEYYFNWRELLSAQIINHGERNVEMIFDASNITFLGGLLPALIIFLACGAASLLLIKNAQKAFETKQTAKQFFIVAIATLACVGIAYTVLFGVRQMWLLQPVIISCLALSCVSAVILTFKKQKI